MKFRFMSLLAGTVLSASYAAAFADSANPTACFDINRYEVRGNTLLSTDVVNQLVRVDLPE